MPYLIWILIALLTVAHQIDWGFAAEPLYLGVIPPGLLFHAILSLMAAGLWLLAVTFCWPENAEVETPTLENREADR